MKLEFPMTLSTATVLQALGQGRLYGFDLMERTGLASGTVYPLLRRLESRGWVEADWESKQAANADGRPPRRYYRLTAKGEEMRVVAEERFPALRILAAGDPSRA